MVERVLFQPGGATEAKQDTIISELQDIEAAVVALEQAPLTDAQLRATPVEVILPQLPDVGNTTVRTSAHGASQFVGAWTQTRDVGVVRLLTVLASTVSAGLGGTFVFEFSEDGSNATISETRMIGDFETVRDFDLINAGAYYRVKFTPSRALVGGEMVFITNTLRTQNDGAFVRLANQEIEEANAAMGQQFAYLKAFNALTGKSVNLRPTDTGALRVADDRFSVGQSGAIKVTGIRDDISVHFFTGTREDEATGIYDDGSVNGTVTFDATEGRAVFAVPSTAGSTAIFRSMKTAVYEPGHTIRGEQTIVVNAQPTGNGFVEWGFGDGSNSIGWRYDSTGLSIIRRKNGVLVNDVAQADWNRDRCDGSVGSEFVFNYEPQALDPLKNNRYAQEFEWLGVAPPDFYIVAPNKSQVNAHTIEFPNQETGTTVPNPELPLYVHVANDTTTGQVLSVACGSWRGGTYSNNTVSYGQQPDGDFVASRADGTVFENTTPLGTSASFTSPWFDSDGWTTLELFVATDQVSASQGIEIQYTNDAGAPVPVVRGIEKFTFTAADVSRGFLALNRVVRLDGFRIKYTNGGVAQGSFFISATVRVSPAGPPLNSLESEIDGTSIAQMARTAIFAKDGGSYTLIGRGTVGGLDVGIVQHEANTPIKSDTSLSMSSGSVGTAGSKIVDSTVVPTGATAVCIQAANNNGNAVIYLATSQAGSVGGVSAGADIAAGQSWTYSVGQGLTTDIWGASSTGTATWRKTWLIGGGA